MITRMFGLICIVMFALSTQAAPRTVEPTPEQSLQIQQYHEQMSILPSAIQPRALDRPFSDFDQAGYLIFSADTDFNSSEAKKTMARHLPADVTLVVYGNTGDSKDAIRRQYQGLIDESRLKVVIVDNSGDGFWSRDGLPIAVLNQEGGMDMVDARYYHSFEPDRLIANWFRSLLHKHNYYYEGGNFMVTDDGACLTVDNIRSKSIPLSVFKDYYGCKRTIRLPFIKGIGHVDESVRVAGPNKVFTDTPEYARILQAEGFQTIMLPRPNRAFETYVNSLLVNGTVFVPVFGQANDAAAISAYEQAGFKTIPIETVSLANDGHGSLHCITMTYPKVPFNGLMKAIGGD